MGLIYLWTKPSCVNTTHLKCNLTSYHFHFCEEENCLVRQRGEKHSIQDATDWDADQPLNSSRYEVELLFLAKESFVFWLSKLAHMTK